MATDKELLRQLALAATPGPWSTNQRGRYWHDEEADVVDADGREVLGVEFVKPIGDVYTTRGQVYADDATYVAATNPAVMLALLDEIEALQAAHDAAAGTAVQAEREAILLLCQTWMDELSRQGQEAESGDVLRILRSARQSALSIADSIRARTPKPPGESK